MSFKFKEVPLGEVCKLGDGAHSKVKRIENGIPYLTSKNIKHGTIELEGVNYISKDDYEKLFGISQKSVRHLQEGDVLIGIIGTFGNCYLYKESDKFGISSSIAIVRPNQEALVPEFLYNFLSSKRFKAYTDVYKGGSVQGYTNLSTIGKIPIYLPSLDEQKAIAKILSDLDEKIETNNEINKKLEEMAQAIFKQWFVDFEFPNEDGNPYKSSGGEMVESELGMIPKGWNIKKLSELADMKNGVNYGRNQEGEKVKVVNVRDFDGSLVVNDKKLDNVFLLQKQINDYRLQKYDTVIVRSAKPGETLLVNDDNLKVYSGFTIRIRPKDYNIKLYVFYCIRNSIRQLENSSNGTIFKNLNQQLLGKVSVIEPKIEVINKYNDFIKTIIDKIYIVNEEINRLTDLRDTLLPKLMSGEIRVPVEN